MPGHRLWLSAVLLPLALLGTPPLAAQQLASQSPQAWQADTKVNKQAQKAAEKAAKVGGPKLKGGSTGPAEGDGHGGPPGGVGGPGGGKGPGGEGGPPGGGKAGHRGGGARHGEVTADAMLRPEMEFAAPMKDTLVLYRSREAVVLGSTQSQDVVILPLSGESVSIAPGVYATVHDDTGALRVDIATSNGIQVRYRYRQQGNTLTVDVHAEGPFPRPGSRFDVQRQYRLATPAH